MSKLLRLGVASLLLAVTACAGSGQDEPRGPMETPMVPAPAPATGESRSPDRPTGDVPDVALPGMDRPPRGDGLERYAGQRVSWQRCGLGEQEFDCTNVQAPLDWNDPDGTALSLFVIRMPATQQPKRGTIFVNPGGPGEPGSLLAPRFPRAGLEDFDIVGWDPRGTGESTSVRCGPAEQIDAFFEADNSPDDPNEREAYLRANRELGASCLEHSGRLLQHISTVETVADLEMLRQLMGDEKLNYFGYSYGTDIGSRYAEIYPDRVGKVVLDGAVNITDSEEVVQATGFDRAFAAFADWCAAQRCSLGGDRQAVQAAVTDLFDELDAEPLVVGDRRLTQSFAVTGSMVLLYGAEDQWRMLLAGIERAREGDGAPLLQYADFYNSRLDDGTYESRQLAFTAIRCLDEPDEGVEGADERFAEAVTKAPVLGPYFGPDYACPTWPVPPAPVPPPVRAAGAAPILVIGTTGDPATPFEHAVAMADQLESGVLLTYEGAGHGAYGGNSSCVDEAVVRYFTSEGPPAAETCR